MSWTKGVPDKPGCFWVRAKPVLLPKFFRILDTMEIVTHNGYESSSDIMDSYLKYYPDVEYCIASVPD